MTTRSKRGRSWWRIAFDDTAAAVGRVILAAGPGLTGAGYQPEALEGRLLEDVVPAEAFARLGPVYREALASGRPSTAVYDAAASGSSRLDLAPVRNEHGAVIGLYALARAVSATTPG